MASGPSQAARLPTVETLKLSRDGTYVVVPGAHDYWTLTKPKVTALIVLTAIVGMVLAPHSSVPMRTLIVATLGVALASGSAAAFNHVIDRGIDRRMSRTRRRPLPTGRMSHVRALVFAGTLGIVSMALLWVFVSGLMAALTLGALVGYAVIYTVWLKRATPYNIVWGGAAGAMPPVLGWVAATHDIAPPALILFSIIFVWTPPHFWALAIARRHDYAKAGIPMLPVTHGIPYTRRQILLYTIVLSGVTLLPVITAMTGLIYLIAMVILNARFLSLAFGLYRDSGNDLPMRTFRFSITYLALCFFALIVDHHWRFLI